MYTGGLKKQGWHARGRRRRASVKSSCFKPHFACACRQNFDFFSGAISGIPDIFGKIPELRTLKENPFFGKS